MLEKADAVPAVKAILVDGQRPAWVGHPVLDAAEVSVYPVCTRPGDDRCTDDGADTVRRAGGTGA